MQWLKHAFAVDPPGPAEPTEAQKQAIDRVAGEVVRRGLATPTLMALEMSRPLNFIGAQAMHFFTPFVSVFANSKGYHHFAEFLELRGAIPYICEAIEARSEAELDGQGQTPAINSTENEVGSETD